MVSYAEWWCRDLQDQTDHCEGILLNVGSGNYILFWHDIWCEASPLKGVSPRLFTLSIQKNLFINQIGTWHEGSWSWNLRWRRDLYDWEEEEKARLSNLIDQKRPKRETSDGVFWAGSGNTSFHAKSITDKIYESSTPLITKWAVNTIWQRYIPPRAQLIIWLAHLEKLKTGDTLLGKGIISPQQALCSFCNLQVESNSHFCLPVDSRGVFGWNW